MILTLRSVYKDGLIGAKLLYDLLRERTLEDNPSINISHRTLPGWPVHRKFVASRPYRAWYFVKADGIIAGNTYLTRRNEIGIHLSEDYRGRGIGKWALERLMALHQPLPAIPGVRSGRFLANINPENAPSIALFTKLGFRHLNNTYALY